MKKETGARAQRAIIEEFMLDIMYEIPKEHQIGEVTITRSYIEGTGGPLISLLGQEVPRLPYEKKEYERVWKQALFYCGFVQNYV